MSKPTSVPKPGDPKKLPDDVTAAAPERLKRESSELPEPGGHPADDAAFAARLRAAREERNFTQAAVANRSRMIDPERRGISRTAIIAYEQGTSKPGIRELRMLCEVLHVTPNWLIYGTDSAAKAAMSSLEFLGRGPAGGDLRDVLTLSLAMLALKGHERDSLLTLALSLAGRALGDVRLSSLMSWAALLQDGFFEALKPSFSQDIQALTLEQLAAHMADEGVTTNMGNRFRLGEEGEILNPDAAIYPGPHVGGKSDIST